LKSCRLDEIDELFRDDVEAESECSLSSENLPDFSRKKSTRRLLVEEHRVAVVIEVVVVDVVVASAVEVVPTSSSEEEAEHTDQVQLELRPVAEKIRNDQNNI
jgi:hypothetical protein